MCQCTPTIRTPWCGRGACVQPPQLELAPGHKLRELRAKLHVHGVRQTIFGRGPEFNEEPGNCMQAAIATVLGQRLEAVPHFLAAWTDDWWDRMNEWLLEHFQVALMGLQAGDWRVPRVIHLMQGRTVRGSAHVVVGYAGELLWDPHPSDVGLEKVETIEMFTAADPRICRGR